MVRLLVLAVIFVLVVIAFRLGRESEHGRLIDLEPDKAESEKWSARTAKEDAHADTVDAKAYPSGADASAGSKTDKKAGTDDVIDVSPDDIEEL